MSKLVDFYDASKRHYQDADLLINDNRTPNGGQLLGFAAECGLKALLVSQGVQTDSSGDLDSADSSARSLRKHIDALCLQVTAYLSGRQGGRYLAMIPSVVDFSDWSTDHRYFHSTAVPKSHPKWQKAAREIIHMIEQAKLDGVVI